MKTSVVYVALWLLLPVTLSGCEVQPQLKPLSLDDRILALGNSLTYGTGVNPRQSYPTVLQQLVNREVINAGIPGEVTSATLRRIRNQLQQYRPGLVVLCIGGNDIIRRIPQQQIKANISEMIQIVKSEGVQMVLLAVPAFGLYPSAPRFYQELAEFHGIPLDNETIPKILRDASLKSDAIHGNAAGYRMLAEAVATLLKRAGAI